ncbi:MAG: hypothetical protein GXO43_04540 [Crenarchaeota archaeon]|nr:hypothetical protein [Thermoproteota archaeon]
MRALSPLVATVIIVAVTLSITVVITLWVSGIITGYTGIERLDIYDTYCMKYNSNYYMILYLKNTGTRPVTIDNIFIDNKPYNQMGFKAFFVNEENFNPQDLNKGYLNIHVNINGTASNECGCGESIGRYIDTTYTYPISFTIDYVARYDNFSYSVGGNVNYTMYTYDLVFNYEVGFNNGTINIYTLSVSYCANYKQLSIMLHKSGSGWVTLYSKNVDLNGIVAVRNWHDLRVNIYTYSNLSLWRISFFLDGKPVVDNVPLYKSLVANAINITIWRVIVYSQELDVPAIIGSVPIQIDYSLDIDRFTIYTNNTPIISYDFNNKDILTLSYNGTDKKDYYYNNTLDIHLYSDIGFALEPVVQVVIVIGHPLPYTLMPGQKAVLVLVSPNVSPGTLYSIIVHSSSGYKYPANIRAP